MEIDLINLMKEEKFKPGLKKRLKIDGKTDEYPSYLIPISYLFYNDMNGRIATYNQQYKDENNGCDLINLLKTDKEKYNKIVANFVRQSASDNDASFNRTKNDIERNGQQVPGVVLSDGRIIDGNRRFTAISELYEKNHDLKYFYFEAVILPAPNPTDTLQWKKIKSLELNLQFNVDEKRDYNRIDFLVSFYENTMNKETALFDKKAYCYESGIKPSEYEKNERIVNVMLDYLKWRDKPNAFYILKKYKLDGPMEDIATATKKMTNSEFNRIKTPIYQYLTLVTSGDRTRDVRSLINAAKKGDSLYTKFSDSVKQDLKSIVNAVKVIDTQSNTVEETKEKNETLSKARSIVEKSFDNANYEATLEQCKKDPTEKLNQIIKTVNSIDLQMLTNLDDSTKNSIKDEVNKIRSLLDRIENKL